MPLENHLQELESNYDSINANLSEIGKRSNTFKCDFKRELFSSDFVTTLWALDHVWGEIRMFMHGFLPANIDRVSLSSSKPYSAKIHSWEI